jgi:hypothetical protein
VISLSDNESQLVDWVSYQTALPWPVEPSLTSTTLELIHPDFDNTLYSSWLAGNTGGTPGSQNESYTLENTLSEEKLSANCFPTCFTDFTTLQFYCDYGQNYNVNLIDIRGTLKKTIKGKAEFGGTYYFDIFTLSEN